MITRGKFITFFIPLLLLISGAIFARYNFHLQYSAGLVVDQEGSVYTGMIEAYKNKNDKAIIKKYKSNGNLSWSRRITLNEPLTFFKAIYLHGNEGFFLTGYKHNRLIRFNSNGNILDTMSIDLKPKNYGKLNGFIRDTEGRMYLLVGGAYIFDSQGIKGLGDSGKTLWTKQLVNPFKVNNGLKLLGNDPGNNPIYHDEDGHLIKYSLEGLPLMTGWLSDYISAFAGDKQGYYYFAGTKDQDKREVYIEKRKGLEEVVWRFESTGFLGNHILNNHQESRMVFNKANELKVDDMGNVYMVGSGLDADESKNGFYLLKVNQNGEQVWKKHLPSSGKADEEVTGLVIHKKSIYLTGERHSRVFISRYDQNGKKIWSKNEIGNDILVWIWPLIYMAYWLISSIILLVKRPMGWWMVMIYEVIVLIIFINI